MRMKWLHGCMEKHKRPTGFQSQYQDIGKTLESKHDDDDDRNCGGGGVCGTQKIQTSQMLKMHYIIPSITSKGCRCGGSYEADCMTD